MKVAMLHDSKTALWLLQGLNNFIEAKLDSRFQQSVNKIKNLKEIFW